jgi:hypothetical protein
MSTYPIIHEFRSRWLPHATGSGLSRLVELLRSGSPLLIHGSFTRCSSQGCLATHLAWHHPQTQQLQNEAGVIWLTKVANINPATSSVILAWDANGTHNWDLREGLLSECQAEIRRRDERMEPQLAESLLCSV